MNAPSRLLVLALAVLGSGCQSLFPPPPEEIGLWPHAAANVSDPTLAKVTEEFWHAWLTAHPESASRLGDPRFSGKLNDDTDSGRGAWRRKLWSFDLELEGIPRNQLTATDLTNARLLESAISHELTRLDVHLEAFTVDPLNGPQVRYSSLLREQQVVGPRERDDYLNRLQAIGPSLRRAGENLQNAASQGQVAHAGAISKSIEQIDRLLGISPLESDFISPVIRNGRLVPFSPDESLAGLADRELGSSDQAATLRTLNPHILEGDVRALGTHVLIPAADDPLPAAKRGALLGRAREIVADDIYPAFAAYRELLRDDLLPVARSDSKPGLNWLSGGRDNYVRLARVHTGQPVDPTAVHLDGLAAVDRIHEQILELGAELFGARNHLQLRVVLNREADLMFGSEEEIVDAARDALQRAEATAPKWIERSPVARCEVVPIPAAEAPESTIAYYLQPTPDLSRPGRYYVNTSEPTTRPRWQAEVLAFHESIPGHHTQIALAQELDQLPAFRRFLGSTAFVEGWALYVEGLADELGLYSSDLDRLGMLSFAAWRAARLVVDTGLHSEGWTREQAVSYLRDHTLLTEGNIQNEVDRYIVWPGQALAYWIGAEEIRGLRRLAELRLGDRFDLPKFHSELLSHGAVELPVLRDLLTEWVAREATYSGAGDTP